MSVTEYEVLDLLYEALPDEHRADLYDVRPGLPRAEFYVTLGGECWRALAERHPHPAEGADQ